MSTKSLGKVIAITLFWLILLCVAPLQTLLAVEYDGDITVVNTVLVDDIDEADEIILARLAAQQANAPTGIDVVAFGLQWMQDTSGWFPMWKLYLTSDIGLLPAALSPRGAKAVQLSSTAPERGHEYEATLSYSSSLGALSIRIVDKTAEQVVYSKGFSVPTCDATVYASHGTSRPYYLPIGTVWSVGTYEQQKAFVEQNLFETRSAPAYIRINAAPVAPSSRYVVTLVHQAQEIQLASISSHVGEQLIPLQLKDLPLGQSTLRLDIVQDDKALLSETKKLMIGRLELAMQPLEVDRSAGSMRVNIWVESAEAIEEKLNVALNVNISELVWRSEQRAYDTTPYGTHTIYSGPLDLANGTVEIVGELPLPNRPGNWKLTYALESESGILASAPLNERFFSTYPPAVIEDGEAYSFVVYPDIHVEQPNYAKMLTRMNGWVAENAEKLNIAGVFQVGDITSHNMTIEWAHAYNAMEMLHGVAPYVLALGNHDMVWENETSTIVETGFDRFFTIEAAKRYSNLVDVMAAGKLHNYYSLFEVGETKYLVLVLEFAPADAVVEWANAIVQQYPDHKVIYITHSYLSRFGRPANYPTEEAVGSLANTGVELWEKLVSKHPNSFMVLSGHVWPTQPTVPYRVERGYAGQYVYELLFDYQNQPNNGNGYFGLLTFHPNNTLEVRIYSPYLEEYANAKDDVGFTSYIKVKLASPSF